MPTKGLESERKGKAEIFLYPSLSFGLLSFPIAVLPLEFQLLPDNPHHGSSSGQVVLVLGPGDGNTSWHLFGPLSSNNFLLLLTLGCLTIPLLSSNIFLTDSLINFPMLNYLP
jgi:hypothetical protein